MQINHIPSFKGIVKVNAPIEKTYKILNHEETTANIQDKHLRMLLSTKEYDQISIVSGSDDKTSYILTGEDAKAEQEAFIKKAESCVSAGTYYGASEEFETAISTFVEKYNKFVDGIIKNKKPFAEINVNKNGTIITRYLNIENA